MLKRIVALLLVVLSVSLLCACAAEPISPSNPAPNNPSSSSKEEGTDNIYDQPFEMELVGASTKNYFSYYRDTTTDVLYIYRANGNDGGLTVMLDPSTGLPMTYTLYMKLAGESIDLDQS